MMRAMIGKSAPKSIKVVFSNLKVYISDIKRDYVTKKKLIQN